QLLKAAQDAAIFLRSSLYDPENRTLCRCFCQGKKAGKGQLDDYAFLIAGLLELYQVSQKPQWLQWAMELTETQIRLFWDEQAGGFYDSVVDPLVAIRLKTHYDGAEPAPNSLVVVNLVRLARLTDMNQWVDLAERTLRSFQGQLQQNPEALPIMLAAQQEFLEVPSLVVIAGRREDAETWNMMEIVHQSWMPGRLLLLADGGENQEFLSKRLPFLETVAMVDDQPTAYICRDYTCQLPVTDPDELKRILVGGGRECEGRD
ncbi:MAG: thioredoxin domain-containing protein, partial [Candidatus Electrothrix sp. AUS4]|nr:thioredoxin domain-containing protein [Candidatus Electrothrix sp. AUS4]